MSDRKQIPGLPEAVNLADNDFFVKRDTSSGTDQKIAASLIASKTLDLGEVTTATGTQTVAGALDSRVIYVDTIADLQALPVGDLVDGQPVQVSGYYAPGDGGGGPPRAWKTGAAGEYEGNGGSIIVPTGGDGSGAWVWGWSGDVNVKWFGAKGDGVADDTAAIDNTVIAHSHVYVPAGEYVVSRSIYIKDSTYVSGAGGTVSILKPASDWTETLEGINNRGVFNVFLVDGFGFYNIGFDTHIHAGTDEVNFINIGSSYTQDGVLNDDPQADDFNKETKNFEILNCYFRKCGDAAINISGNYAHSGIDVYPWTNTFNVSGNIFHEALDEGGQLMEIQGGAGRGSVTNNRFRGPFSPRSSINTVRYALRIQSGQDLTISDNTFYDWDGLDGEYDGGINNRWNGAGIHFQRSSWGARRITITGNVFSKVGCGVSLRQGSEDIVISGNTFTHVYMSPLYFDPSEDFIGDLPENSRHITGSFSNNILNGWGYIPNNNFKYAVYDTTGYIQSFDISNNSFTGQSDVEKSRLYRQEITTSAGALEGIIFNDNIINNVDLIPKAFTDRSYAPFSFSKNSRLSSDVSVPAATWTRIDTLPAYADPLGSALPIRSVLNMRITGLEVGDEVTVEVANFNRSVVHGTLTFTAASGTESISLQTDEFDSDLAEVWVYGAGTAAPVVQTGVSNHALYNTSNKVV